MLEKFITEFRGFKLREDPSAPVTGRWRGVRYGVSVCAGTKAALINVIRLHTDDHARTLQEWQAQGQQCDKILRHKVTECVTF